MSYEVAPAEAVQLIEVLTATPLCPLAGAVGTGAPAEVTVVASFDVADKALGADAETLLVNCPGVVFADTSTARLMAGSATPTPNVADWVQVRVESVQLHPEPDIAVAVNPAGRVSTTVTVPVLNPGPAFVTVRV